MNVQVNKEHYDFENYLSMERWCSYYKQVKEIIQSGAKKIALIGIGDGLIITILKALKPEIDIVKVDFDQELNPDICCDVLELSKYLRGGVEAVVCCQVLEHLPYNDFKKALQEISNCLLEHGILILSLPDSGIDVGITLNVPKVHLELSGKVCRYYKSSFEFNGEHYWEINSARKYSANMIRKDIRLFFDIHNEYLVKYNKYHRFYILRKK